MTWTFQLRKGVYFHNGDRLSSADVKASFDRIKAATTASAKASEFADATVEATGPYEVTIKLSRPAAPFLATLASGWSAILPKSLIDAGYDFSTRPVGTGPFMFSEWVKDSRIVMVRNPRYWMQDLPKSDKVTFQIVPERAVQVQGLMSGALDIVDGVEGPDLKVLSRNKNVRVDTVLSSMVLVLATNCSKPALQDLKVRQAISMAIDKARVLDVAYGGGVVGGSFMDAGDPYYTDYSALLPHDLEKAKSLLAEAGWQSDTVLDLVLPQNYEAHVKAGQMYQDMLAQVGVKAKIRLVDWPTWLSEAYKGGKYDLTVIGHTGKLDPDGRLGGYGTAKTYVRWVNPEVASLIEKAKVTADFTARKALYDQALLIMAKEVPHVYLGTSNSSVALRSNIVGFVKTPKLDTYDLRRTEKK